MESKIIPPPDASIVRLETETHDLQLPNETVEQIVGKIKNVCNLSTV